MLFYYFKKIKRKNQIRHEEKIINVQPPRFNNKNKAAGSSQPLVGLSGKRFIDYIF